MTTKPEPEPSNTETYAVVLRMAAKLLAWKAARQRVRTTDCDSLLRSAAECIILADFYEAKK